jgi:SAM-dependent methyltransferase
LKETTFPALKKDSVLKGFLGENDFSRLDESDDLEFYSLDRFVSHLDSLALTTVQKIIENLVVEERPVILDLMAGWDSHLPEGLHTARLVGLGLNQNELQGNRALTEYRIHDLNRDPTIPFPDRTFDAVLNTVSIDYLTHPLRIFEEVNRVLKPGGLFLVIFSNRMFPEKAVKIWRESDEEGRMLLVLDYFREAENFEKPGLFVSKGKPRPPDDKYAHLGIASDPIYAVFADKVGGDPSRKKRRIAMSNGNRKLSPEELKEIEKEVKNTLCCPYCGEKMKKWAVPDNPFSQTWDNDFMYICFNDACPYYVRGWDHMAREVQKSVSYRLMYNPDRDYCLPIPVPTPFALKEGIVSE